MAVWQAWFSIDALQLALTQSKTKIASAKGSVWSVVAGPATALIATAERIGWKILPATIAQDDLQHQWNFAADSPAAIGNAVAQIRPQMAALQNPQTCACRCPQS